MYHAQVRPYIRSARIGPQYAWDAKTLRSPSAPARYGRLMVILKVIMGEIDLSLDIHLRTVFFKSIIDLIIND